jgi:pyruvate dehydrogenase E2 component (dihydrolipoamide acetyltransferase)
MADRTESLDYAERWLSDAFVVIPPPGGVGLLEVDMSRPRALLGQLRDRGVPVTFNHVFVRAAALALAQNPKLHLLVAGTRRVYPERVDIGLSVAIDSFYAPVMILEDAARKTLPALVEEITRRTPEVREKAERDLRFMRGVGRLVPFAWLRRLILRLLFNRLAFRRQLVGTFQVSCVPTLDTPVPLVVTAAAVLGVGRVRDRVVAIDGQPAVRPTVVLSCTLDHKAWDGIRTAQFMNAVRKILEEGELDRECAAD